MDAWGKFDKSSGRVHRLEHHCADVAACFEALLGDPVLRARFVKAAGDNEFTGTTVARLTFLAYLHDFGKLNAGFQFKVRPRNELPSRAPRPAGHIAEALLCFDQPDVCELLGLHDIVDEWGAGIIPLAHAMLAHHGRPARRPTRSGSGPPELWKPFAGYDPRATARLLSARGRSWFPTAFSRGPHTPDSPALAHLFAGIVALADQLGSDEEAFRYEPDPDPDYIERARRIAADVIRSKGFRRRDSMAVATATGSRDFRSLFDYPDLRPSQRAVTDAPVDHPLLILESETGSGKTEAAILRFAALWHAGLVDGLYFAVPTRAAAKQLHERVRRALERLFPPAAHVETVLAVPGYLVAGDAEGRRVERLRS
ncbi:MAG: CRISPR-associated endonuclease Cas3'' [Acidobacteria bacterium]|nr:CRISPR-associated endonuclease Cas3'' [Acidobacteriota bacterium]